MLWGKIYYCIPIQNDIKIFTFFKLFFKTHGTNDSDWLKSILNTLMLNGSHGSSDNDWLTILFKHIDAAPC